MSDPKHLLHDDEPEKSGGSKFTEFDCPDCSANNPMADGFRYREEVRCNYCGEAYEVKERGDGRFKLVAR